MNNQQHSGSTAGTGSSSSSNFHGPKLDFPHFNGDDPTRWIYRDEQNFSLHNTIDVNKVSLAPFIWNMNPFNGSAGTSRLMTRYNGQIFANSFCTDLDLVVLMNSQEHSPNFIRLAL